jgi:hypothetical protein
VRSNQSLIRSDFCPTLRYFANQLGAGAGEFNKYLIEHNSPFLMSSDYITGFARDDEEPLLSDPGEIFPDYFMTAVLEGQNYDAPKFAWIKDKNGKIIGKDYDIEWNVNYPRFDIQGKFDNFVADRVKMPEK